MQKAIGNSIKLQTIANKCKQLQTTANEKKREKNGKLGAKEPFTRRPKNTRRIPKE